MPIAIFLILITVQLFLTFVGIVFQFYLGYQLLEHVQAPSYIWHAMWWYLGIVIFAGIINVVLQNLIKKLYNG